jgi:hypothetical protein
MNLSSTAEGGSMEGIVQRMTQTFGLNYTNALALYKGWQENPNMAGGDVQSLIDRHRGGLPSVESSELETAKITAEVMNLHARIGQIAFDGQIPELERAIGEARGELNVVTGALPTGREVEALIEASVPHLASDGGGRGLHFSLGMQEFIAAESRANDPNAQTAANRFNTEILPRLPEEMPNEMVDYIDQLQNQFYKATQGIPATFSEAGNKVGTQELADLNATMNSIEVMLGKLNTTLSNIDVDISEG